MSNSRKHKIIGKFKNGIIDKEDVPIAIRKMWNRHNFDFSYFRKIKDKLKYNYGNKKNIRTD